jgi:hypothetical protein
MVEGTYDEARAWAYAGNKGLQLVLPLIDDHGVSLNGLPSVNVVVDSFQNVN